MVLEVLQKSLLSQTKGDLIRGQPSIKCERGDSPKMRAHRLCCNDILCVFVGSGKKTVFFLSSNAFLSLKVSDVSTARGGNTHTQKRDEGQRKRARGTAHTHNTTRRHVFSAIFARRSNGSVLFFALDTKFVCVRGGAPFLIFSQCCRRLFGDVRGVVGCAAAVCQR